MSLFINQLGQNKKIVDHSPALIWLADEAALFKYFNQSWLQFTGKKLEEEIGDLWFSGIHQLDIDLFLDQYLTAFKQQQPFTVTFRLLRYDQEYRWIYNQAVPLFDNEGELEGYLGNCFDISDLKLPTGIKLEKQLEENENRYQTLFENTGSASCVINKDRLITLANKKMVELSGYSREEIEGKMSWTSFVKNQNDLKRMLKYHQNRRSKNCQAPQNYEFEFQDKSGCIKHVLATVDLIKETDQSIASLVDITCQKRVEKDLEISIHKLSKMVDSTIKALGSTVEVRDSYTYGHQQRVARLALSMARELQLSDEHCHAVYLAAIIHDLGKLKIPAEILSKPTTLSSNEYEIIKHHPVDGYNIIKNIDFPWPLAEIVKQHHERLDGSGYPEGLKAEEILIEAKIITIADVIDAMTSHRPYRPALGAELAIAEIEKNKGVLYDPEITNVVKSVLTGDADLGFKTSFNEM